MVFFKLAVLVLVLVLGITAFTADNFSPFFVEGEGISGTVTAATLIFFAYIGFDAVSTSSEEVKEPERDLPRAIIGSLLIATTLYILVAIVATGALPFDKLKGAGRAARQGAERGRGHGLGGQHHLLRRARGDHQRRAHAALRAVADPLRDEPRRADAEAHLAGERRSRGRPVLIIAICGVLFAALAAFVPLKEIVQLVNIGTLFAFVVVNLGVIILRRTRPDLPRGYRVPLVPWFPIIGTALCVLPDGRPARDHLVALLHLDGTRPRSSTSPTGAATRACARVRSSRLTPSFPAARSGPRPGPP